VLKSGTAAPPFEVLLHTGEVFRLSDIRGKCHLVLYFYPRDFTAGCTREACSFRDHFEEIKHFGALVLGVSPDSVERHQQFARDYHLAYPLIADPHHTLAKLYEASFLNGSMMMRVTYVIDLNGVIRGVFHHEILIGNHWEKTLQILNGLQKATT
jgi:thioredoxin-dependent peroxiredoxin